MENFAYNPQQESQSAYQKYVDQRKKWKVFTMSEGDKLIQKKQQQELEQIEDQIRRLENQPIMINQDEVLHNIANIDRLKTLKFLTSMHLNIKNGIVKQIEDDDQQDAFQEFINQDENLKNMHQKQQKIKKSQQDDIVGKLDFNQQVMLKFIDQQQRIDMKFKNQECQYQTPIHYQMIENQEKLLSQQVEIEMQQKMAELQKKIDNQLLAKQTSNDEIQQMHKKIKNLKKDNQILQKDQEDNLLLLNMELNQKDSQQKAQYALILQNKLKAIYSQVPQDAATHNIDLITILTQRAQDQNLQIQKLEELLKDLCSRFNINLEIKKLDLSEFDDKINTIYKEAQPLVQVNEKQKVQKVAKKKETKTKTVIQYEEEQAEINTQKKNIITNQVNEQESENEEFPQKKKQMAQTTRNSDVKKSVTIFQTLNKEQNYQKLSLQDQMNLIIQNQDLTYEVKKKLLKDFTTQNRSLLSQADSKLLQNMTSMNQEEFQNTIQNQIVLPSKIEQIKRMQKIAEKFEQKDDFQKTQKISNPNQKSKYMDQTNTSLLKQKKIMFQEEINSYFLDWRLKEYLTLKGITPKIRQYYIQLAKQFFIEMEYQLQEFEKSELIKQQPNNNSTNFDQTTLDTFDQTNYESVNNTIQSKMFQKETNTQKNANETLKQPFDIKLKQKKLKNQIGFQNILLDDDDLFSWVTPKTQLTLYQQFYYELWLNRQKRKNTIPNKPQFQEILNKMHSKNENNDESL